ncbi:MAG: DUF1501 domain-containing protein [Planctomycetes bacterium]|nr:DUF1501 domain-containing protein [Planctomycetota bacterium]
MEPLVAHLPSPRRPSWASQLTDRRMVLKAAGLAAGSWLTPLAELLAREETARPGQPAQSVILLWMAGGPSQLETFDPHPGKDIAGESKAIDTALKGVKLGAGLERLAEKLPLVTLVRNVVSKEGDHERGAHTVKTGYRPDPTLVHPSIGAICCHQLPVGHTEIPRHISIQPDRFVGRGGYLGNQYDAFQVYDPKDRLPDIKARVSDERHAERLEDLKIVESTFARGRQRQVQGTLHGHQQAEARKIMTSEQLKAFEIEHEPAELRTAYGDSPFGRGCLAARRLIEVGVRCVEVTLSGWDTHTENLAGCEVQNAKLDPAISTLLEDLKTRGLLDSTIVICAGEFGRTPIINRLAGRDHWPHGFSMLLAGGRLPRGLVLGETDPEGAKVTWEQGTPIADIHATLLTAMGINPALELMTPVGRPMKLSEGTPVSRLLG